MNASKRNNLKAAEKIGLFRSFFSGLKNVYGACDPGTGRIRQEKKPVTHETILAHLQGKCHYGVYLLDGDRTKAIVADFDHLDQFPPFEFVNAAKHYGLPAYIEISKSKGFHVWIFFKESGVKASKARLVVKNILEEIECPDTEIFPKQDTLNSSVSFGNFIFAPLFGQHVSKGKTVFVDTRIFEPFPDQWSFLESIERVDEQILDDIIEINELKPVKITYPQPPSGADQGKINNFGLPMCAQKMLQEGVSKYQRVSCFRLAVHLKRLGLPLDVALVGLKEWARKNRPKVGKEIIAEKDIIEQATYAYDHDYRGYGCSHEAVKPFCQTECYLHQLKQHQNYI